jgi:peptidyl-prolyl cis-trans isomerase D
MLRFLRKYSTSTGIKILYGVLAALFVIWGVGSVGGARVDVVARVYGETINRRDLERTTAVLRRRYEEMLKGNFSADLARSLDLRGRALDQLVDEALLRHEAERLGVTVSEAELVEAITKMPELQDNGRFNRDRLESALSYQKDRGEFETEIRRSILFQRLNALVTDGVQVPDGEIEDRYRRDREQVDLAFVRIAAADLEKTASLSDDDLQKYVTDHADRYRVPARVRARYAAYRAADFAAQVAPTDGEVAEYYELHKDDRFTQPEQVRAGHILVKLAPDADEPAKAAAHKKANDLLAKVKAGSDFAALAVKHSDDPGSAPGGGDLGLFPRGRMAPEFERAAFALEPGAVSDVVESPFGLHIIKVEEHQAGGVQALDGVRDQIVTTIRTERALDLARKQATDDRRSVGRGKPLAEAVGSRPLGETPPFAAGAEVPGVGRIPAFSDAAFALADGQVSDVIETDDALYLLTPFERVEARSSTLDEVRDRVEADARRERGQALAKERAEALLARAKEIGLDKAAAQIGAPVEETGPFERQAGAIPKINGAIELRTEAFTLTPEQPLAPKVYAAGADSIVAALRARTPADMAGFAAARNALQETLLQQKRVQAVTAYLSFLKERARRDGALEVRTDALGRG